MHVEKKASRYITQKVLRRYGKGSIKSVSEKHNCNTRSATMLLAAKLIASHENELFFLDVEDVDQSKHFNSEDEGMF